MQEKLQIMWEGLRETGSQELRRRLVLQYLDLIRYVIGKFHLEFWKNSFLERDDIFEFGILGLISAVDRYSADAGVKFETYAIPRIRGAILDEMRKLDWVPRSVRKNNRLVQEASDQIVTKTGRTPLDSEIADKLDMSLEEYNKMLQTTMDGFGENERPKVHRIDGELNDFAVEDESEDLIEQIDEEERRTYVINAIEHLNPRYRLVIALYYYEGLRFAEIAQVLRITESRVSQIHNSVIKQMRENLTVLQA
jgi:RNA polymerase sigma factor FliA